MFQVNAKPLGSYDVAVCGGGIAGVCAAVTAARQGAKVVLIESSGMLGGTMTLSGMGNLIDADNKGGIIQEMRDFLNERGMTWARRGERFDENGKIIPGNLLHGEGLKYFFDKICNDAGVKVLFHSTVCSAKHTDGHIHELLLCTMCGNFSLDAKVYIDASGSGALADLVGCQWECGDPDEHRPSPVSMGVSAIGFPADYNGTDTEEQKTVYANNLKKYGIEVSAGQVTVTKSPYGTWGLGGVMDYGVVPDDIERLSQAIYDKRKEAFDLVESHRRIPGFENVKVNGTNPQLGIREGRRIFGHYRISNEDILSGARFEDAVCLVTFHVDVHKLHAKDTIEQTRGYEMKPYHIPYRSLVPLGSDNMLLAGRCISGDFYPFSSYRVIGNMAGVGEAAGYAAAICARENIKPIEVDGKQVSAYMADYLREPV